MSKSYITHSTSQQCDREFEEILDNIRAFTDHPYLRRVTIERLNLLLQNIAKDVLI